MIGVDPDTGSAPAATGIGRLSRATVVYGLGQVLVRSIGFITLPIFTRFLSPTDYGVTGMLGMVAFAATPVFSLGLGAAMPPCYVEQRDAAGRAATVWTTVAILAPAVSCLVGLGTVCADAISRALLGTTGHADLVPLFLVGTAASILAIPFALRIQLDERARLYAGLSGTAALLTAGLTIALVAGLGWGLRGFILGSTLGQIANLVLLAIPAAGGSIVRPRYDLAGRLLRAGFPLIPSFALLFVIQQSNRYFLQEERGLDEVGLLSIGANLGHVMNVAVTALTTAWTPFFLSYADRQAEARYELGRITSYYVLAFGSLTLLFFFAARPGVLILTHSAYHDAYRVVGPVAAAHFFSGLFCLVLPPIYFASRISEVNVGQSVGAFAALALGFLGAKVAGFAGAGLAFAASTLVMTTAQHLWNVRHRRTRFTIDYEWGRLGRFASIFVVMSIVAILERQFTLAEELGLFLAESAALLACVYRLLDAGERDTLKRVLSLRRIRA